MVVAYAHLVSLFIVSYVALAYGASPACIEAHRLHSHGLLQRDLCAQALGGPKVALLFLDGGHMPFEELWRRWFVDIAGLAYSGCRRPGNYSEACKQTSSDTDPVQNQHLYTVYVQQKLSSHGFPEGHLFHGYGLAQSRWLEPNAARWMLLHEALLNPVNAYFVLLAESGVPLYLAAALYLQIIHEPRSRLDANCEGVPKPSEGGVATYIPGADGVSPHSNTRPSQSFLLNHRHAVLANMHLHEYLFSSPEEGFLGGLMHLYHFENDTTCDGQGPTYANWTRQEKHAATYHSVSSDLLISMRLSSASADVICDWRVALAQGADLAHFHSVATQVWLTVAPEFKPMHSSCPLFARKLAPEALSSYMAALWHA